MSWAAASSVWSRYTTPHHIHPPKQRLLIISSHILPTLIQIFIIFILISFIMNLNDRLVNKKTKQINEIYIKLNFV